MPGGSGVVDMVDVSPSDFNTPTVTANFNMPTFISNPSHPTLSNGLQNQADETVRGVLAPDRYNPETPLPESSLSEDEEQNILLPDLSPWETLAGNVQAPGNVPVVHGTPNISGVPVVHGTPPAATPPASLSGTPAPTQPTVAGTHPTMEPQPVHHPPTPRPQQTSPVTGPHPVQPPPKKHAHTGQVQPASPKQKHTRQKIGLHKSGSSYLMLAAIIVAVIVAGGIGTMLAIASTHSGSTGKHTITAKPPHLAVQPSSFNLGTLVEGNKVSLAIVISNSGLQRLQWKADTSGTPWLQVRQGTGLIEQGKFQQCFLEVNTAHLKAGKYTGTAHITSNGGNQDVSFTLAVTSQIVKQAKLYVDTTSLDFGQLPPGQPATLSIIVGNVGTTALNWQATTGSSWLTLNSPQGSIAPNGQSQTLQMTADTTNLAAGSYAATVQIDSNGGDTQVEVRLLVQSTPPPVHNPVLAAGVTSFSVPGDPNCSYNQAVGWTCTVVLSSYASAQTNLNWSASSTGVAGVTFTPSSDTLSPGKTEQVSINIPNVACSTLTSADLAFTGPGNRVDVLWNCTPPQLTASPTNFTNGCFSCTVTLALAQGSQGGLSWSGSGFIASGGITVTPSSGTIYAGQTAQVTFSIPSVNCPANADLNFTGQNNGIDIHVPWSCNGSIIKGSTSTINANTDCPYSNGWTCTVTLTSDPNGQGIMSWSASGGVSGTSFNPSSGTLQPGQTVAVAVTVPGISSGTSCPTQANLTFTGPLNTITIPWSCSPPTLKLSSTNLSVPDAICPYTPGTGWTCTETLSLANQGDPDLSWNTAGSIGGSRVQYSPSNGTLSGTQQTSVTITIPDTVCPTNTSLDFLVSGGGTVSATWSCAAPQITVSPSGTITCPQNSDGSWTCSITLGLASGSQGSLNWSSSTALSGANITPSSGTLSSSGSGTPVTINIPANDCTNSTFTFAGSNSNSINVQWQCTAPQLQVSPGTLNSTDTSTCPYDSYSSIWRCTVTLNNIASSSNSASINWSASTNLSGVTFDNTTGTIQANQSQTVTMTIPASACTSGSFTFQGTYNTVTVLWNCISSSTTQPTPSPSPTPQATDTPKPTPTDTPTPTPTSTSTSAQVSSPVELSAFVLFFPWMAGLAGWGVKSVRRTHRKFRHNRK